MKAIKVFGVVILGILGGAVWLIMVALITIAGFGLAFGILTP